MRINITISLLLLMSVMTGPLSAQKNLEDYCRKTFEETTDCPAEECMFLCANTDEKQEGCDLACMPKDCRLISKETCPFENCQLMINCSGEVMCHFKMTAPPPSCGDISYAGQDVDCCEGLIRRCGIEFIDGSCDMEGKNSVYELPICIPCGDGLCGQFENTCNCPEDCK